MWGVMLCVLTGPGQGVVADASPHEAVYATGVFEVYERNKREGIPNYITDDVLLLSYSMIHREVGKALERERYTKTVRQLIDGLAAQVAAGRDTDEVQQANRDYLAILTSLMEGRAQVAGAGEPQRAQAELDLVLAAQTMARSPLWGQTIDYTQCKPRGHYSGDEQLARYFRTVRYAGSVLFAIKDSQATGVSEALANRLTQQARRLARSMAQNEALASLYDAMLSELTWRFGPPEDITHTALLAVDAAPAETLRQRLLEHARTHRMQPRIIGGVVDQSRLEDGVTAADVMTGWRLLPQRYTPAAAAFQRLVFDATGEFQGAAAGAPAPFGLTTINGRAVKGFPLLAELMAMLGSQASHDDLRQRGETAFAGYDAAWQRATAELTQASGLAALHQQLMQTGFASTAANSGHSAARLTSMRAFWTWQRYASLLYAKQSYTMVAKSLELAQARPGAWLDASLPLYQALARVVDGHRRHTPHPAWEAFATILERIMAIASRQLLVGHLSAEDEGFLNGVDTELTALTGGRDSAIIVDIHTNPASAEVLQEATGKAQLVSHVTSQGTQARGARLTQCEFKQAMADRLTDQQWQERLAASEQACGQAVSPTSKER
jgi:hypothetical protein